MKNSLLITTLLLLPIFSIAQNITCDTATIFATDGVTAVCFEIVDNVHYVFSNNYPDHTDDYNQSQFTLTENDREHSMCAYPDTNSYFTPMYEEVETTVGCTDIYGFGIMVNGVTYDPNSGEYFEQSDGSNNIDWHVEATSTTNNIGQNMGTNGGHLNSKGYYHYHNIPTDYFVNDLGIDGTSHSPIVGYAADGFPVYYKYVYQNPNNTSSPIVALSSGYSLRSGNRPGDGLTAPDGAYDGEYYEDYEYTTTTLDSCNGRYAKTPDFPNGTYYYVLTDNYPYIPRCFKGTYLDPTYRVGPSASCPSSTAATDCAASVPGCMDPFANNYNPNANNDNGSCTYSVVPVELTTFTAEKQNENVLLKWTTETEIDNDYFDVEWSYNGINFEKIGQVQGYGSTIETQEYEFLHVINLTGFESLSSLYYRLKQVDFDGEFEYSKTINIEINDYSNTAAVKVFPNPTSGFITIETNKEKLITIRNIYGQIVTQQTVNGTQQLDLSQLSAGIYFVNDGLNTQKLILR